MKKQIDFKFKSNWKTFQKWYDKRTLKGLVTTWADQRSIIETLFNKTSPSFRPDWIRLWKDHSNWFETILYKKSEVLWSENKRQIETLLLNQVAELKAKVWVVVAKNKNGIPSVFSEVMSHDDANKCAKELGGNENGEGGYDHIEKAIVVNLNSLL